MGNKDRIRPVRNKPKGGEPSMSNPKLQKLRRLFPLSWADTGITLGLLTGAALLCLLLRVWDDSDVYASMLFLLAVVIVSRFTNGYFYGILASLAGVFCVNYLFTYPYFAFNFTISGYPLTFISMLAVSVITSAMTTQIKEQEKLRGESEKEKMRGNLLRAVSHDLRTPLTSIVGSTSAVLENEDRLTAQEKRELLTGVKEDAQWLIRMVENLLSITRISEETAKINKEYEAAEEVVAESARKFSKQFPHIALDVSAPDELLMVPMDAILIEQVIGNLLENAALHGKTTSRIRLSLVRRDHLALFTVEDDGVGIPEDKLDGLFDGYLGKPGSLESDGKRNMGIGLSVCNTIVRAHGGYMTGENLPYQGAKFQFALPLEEETPCR